jgi:hypothetical protein
MKLARMTRSPELWSPDFSPEGQEYNRQTVTDSDTGATAASITTQVRPPFVTDTNQS